MELPLRLPMPHERPLPTPACLPCRKAHHECAHEVRPCKRCIRLGKEELCISAPNVPALSLTPSAPEPRPKGRPRKVRRVIGKRAKPTATEQEPPGLTHSVPMTLPSFAASRLQVMPAEEPSCTLHEEDHCDPRGALPCTCESILAELDFLLEDAIVVPHLAHSV